MTENKQATIVETEGQNAVKIDSNFIILIQIHMNKFGLSALFLEWRLALNFHSPPMSSLLSKQVGIMPSSRQAFMLVRPEGPAPITATLCTIMELQQEKGESSGRKKA